MGGLGGLGKPFDKMNISQVTGDTLSPTFGDGRLRARPALCPVIPPRAPAIRSAADPHPYCPASTPLPHPLPCAATPVSSRIHLALAPSPHARHARSVPPPPAHAPRSRLRLHNARPDPRPHLYLSPIYSPPSLRARPRPITALPLRAPVSVPARQSSPAHAPPPRHPPVRCPAHSVPPPAAPTSNFCAGTGVSSASGARHRSIHICVPSAATRSSNPASTSVPSAYPPLLLYAHHLASEYTKSAYHKLAPMEPKKLFRAPLSASGKVRESNRFRECIDRASEGF
ncbi:hypothetical protein B0H14DRAFT_3716511 [Mycena olivaceomarginata]|nr:hypothetical protein B0H14DRAFT_3716511 [Mycena olivaceomarginata]